MKQRVGIYLRVSTDGQTTENQRRELEAVAARSGWEVVDFYDDAGISGSNGREKRPWLGQAAEGCHGPQDQHDCGLVGRPARPQSPAPGRLSTSFGPEALRT